MAASEEQESLLTPNEKTPENKHANSESRPNVDLPIHSSGTPPDPPRTPWSTSLFGCLGSNDEFFSSDLEVCLLGSCAPCVLYASNVERLYPTTENTFTNHFLSYSGLLCLGNLVFGCNALAPCFSYANRTEIRNTFNLVGTGECLAKSCGCSDWYAQSENRECIEAVGDFATHYLCHPCALCQEGREIRRRTVHPGFIRSFMAAPTKQEMSA